MTEKMIQKNLLVPVNEYRVDNLDKQWSVYLPKQFRDDNDMQIGDRIVVYRNAENWAELIIRIEKES